MRVVAFTPPLLMYPSEISLTLLKPSITILFRSVIGFLRCFCFRWWKLDMDILRRARKVEERGTIKLLSVKIIDNHVS